MIQSLPCPVCHRTLVLAADVSLQAVLRCRHCSHQFVLGEMLETDLGYWEVIKDPLAPDPVAATSTIETSSDSADDSELELAESGEYVSPQIMLKKQPEKKAVDWSKFEPITHEQYERMRRKGKSPLWSTLSVLMGGLASLPIATLLIWHVLGKDPLQMGPVVARYVPWIVPTRFQPYEPEFAAEQPPQAPPAGASGFPRFDHIMESTDSNDPDSVGSSTSTPGNPDPPQGIPSANNTPAPRPMAVRDRRAPRAFPQRVGSAPAAATASDSPTDSVGQVVPNNPLDSNVFASINQVEKDLEIWAERGEDRDIQRKLAQQTYANLSALAIAMDELPAGSPLQRLARSELHSVGRSVAEHPDVQQLIQAGSRFWLTSHRSDERIGLALVVEAAEETEIEGAWKVTPSTAIGEPSLTIAVPKEVAASIAPGKSLFVLGCVKTDRNAETLQPPADESANAAPQLVANFVLVLEL